MTVIQNVSSDRYIAQLTGLRGLTIAVVYTFEGEDSEGFKHYDVWRMDVVGDWLRAIEEIGSIPYIMDVRTFGQKALNNTLPHIDYVVNLNAGNCEISVLSLIPSICAFKGIPCLPCDASASLVGEHKQFSNIIAESSGLVVPSSDRKIRSAIHKPTFLGSSIGIKRTSIIESPTLVGFSQEFISGFDLSTPILFHPSLQNLVASDSVAYLTDPFDPEWFLSAEEKSGKSSYRKMHAQTSRATKECFTNLALRLGISTFCRIDARVQCTSESEVEEFLQTEIPDERIRFIEINPMPTIRDGINFCNALQSENQSNDFLDIIRTYNNHISKPSVVGFILSSSILGYMNS